MKNLKIALAQLNFTVGDIEGNTERILASSEKAYRNGANLIIFSELAINGYTPEDLVLRRSFQKSTAEAVKKIAKQLQKKEIAVIVGGIEKKYDGLFNSAFFIYQGKVISRQKNELPNYGVFDEERLFDAGKNDKPVMLKGVNLGIMVCEDMWFDVVPKALKSADILISINGSPYEKTKYKRRIAAAKKSIDITGKPLIYVNQVGGQDELIFDGDSFVLGNDKKLQVKLPSFEEKVEITEWQKKGNKWVCEKGKTYKNLSREEAVYLAMATGLKDYVNKNKFLGVVIGLSGGVDSALSAAVAVDVLGNKRVQGLFMPSRFTSKESEEEARQLAKNLGIRISDVSIEPAFETLKKSLQKSFAGKKEDNTEENIQARVRGILLMAFSNKFGLMVLTTGNKSEMSVGYATLYGDMCGGYSVLKDIYKTEVYKLAKWRNANIPSWALGRDNIIPKRTITRAPTAELRANQKDQDTLPPYHILDDILEKLIELEMSVEDIVKTGHRKALVEKVLNMIIGSEYKRRQAPPGVKITGKSFGRDRRYPITNKFRK